MPIKSTTKSGVIQEEMHRFKKKKLHSGKGGPVVNSRKQALAIALSESRRRGYK